MQSGFRSIIRDLHVSPILVQNRHQSYKVVEPINNKYPFIDILSFGGIGWQSRQESWNRSFLKAFNFAFRESDIYNHHIYRDFINRLFQCANTNLVSAQSVLQLYPFTSKADITPVLELSEDLFIAEVIFNFKTINR